MIKRFISFIFAIFGGSQTTAAEQMGYAPVKFYREAAYHGQHGVICVDHRRLGLRDVEVGFVFVGMTKPPQLDKFAISYIWDQALAQGYIPKSIVAYGFDIEAVVHESADAFMVAIASDQNKLNQSIESLKAGVVTVGPLTARASQRAA